MGQKRSNTHFVLLSNSEIPLYSFEDLYERITSKPMSRLHRMSFNWDQSLGRKVWQASCGDWQAYTGPGCYSKADQWSMWTREDATFFAENNFLKYLKPRTLFVDEQY